MTLNEIAKKILNIDSNNIADPEYLKELVENYPEEEELLIEPLMDYFMYEKLDLCGCGSPEDTYEIIRRYLHVRKDAHDGNLPYNEVCDRYMSDLHINYSDEIQYGMLQFLMYILDSHGFTEHGSSVGGCWLTESGEMFLTVLDAWHSKNMINISHVPEYIKQIKQIKQITIICDREVKDKSGNISTHTITIELGNIRDYIVKRGRKEICIKYGITDYSGFSTGKK